MKKRWWVLLSVGGLVAGYFAWMSRPEFSDRAELTDTCSFPTITNAQYRALIAEAKTLIEPRRQAIRDGSGNIEQGTPNPPLGDVVVEFVKRSRSTEETFVRLYALGRALDGRVQDVAPVGGRFPGPWVLWTDRGPDDRILIKPRLMMNVELQGPPGVFRYPTSTWLLARAFGRRYEEFGLGASFDVLESVSLAEALAGPHIATGGAYKSLLIWPLNSIRWGDVRVENRCPDAEQFLSQLDRLLKQRKN